MTTTTCMNPNCGISLAPGATTCWLCGHELQEFTDEELAALDARNEGSACEAVHYDKSCLRDPVFAAVLVGEYRAARAPLVAEVERLRAELADTRAVLKTVQSSDKSAREQWTDCHQRLETLNVNFSRNMKELGDALKENRDLRAELDAANVDLELMATPAEVRHALGEAIKQRDDLRARLEAAERRGAVDRERAIKTATDIIRYESSSTFTDTEEFASFTGTLVVDAILGAAKAEPVTPPAFVPSPTGETPSEEIRITAIKSMRKAYGLDVPYEDLGGADKHRWTKGFDAVYSLIAADHAAQVQRVRELEKQSLEQSEAIARWRSEVDRLLESGKAEAERLKAENAKVIREKERGLDELNTVAAQLTMVQDEVERLKAVIRNSGECCARIVTAVTGEPCQLATAEEAERVVKEMQAAASKPCLADGMNSAELSIELQNIDRRTATAEEHVRQVRELFRKGAK